MVGHEATCASLAGDEDRVEGSGSAPREESPVTGFGFSARGDELWLRNQRRVHHLRGHMGVGSGKIDGFDVSARGGPGQAA